MNKLKHTSGQLRVINLEDQKENIIKIVSLKSDGYHELAMLRCDDQQENRANAYLFAAAPEMLEDLIKLVKMFKDNECYHNIIDYICFSCQKTIEKAT